MDTDEINATQHTSSEAQPLPIDVIVSHKDVEQQSLSGSEGEYVEARSQMGSQLDIDSHHSEETYRKRGYRENGITRLRKTPVEAVDDDDLELEDDEDDMETGFCFPTLDGAKEQAEHFMKKVWEAGWKVTHFGHLPEWLQDNDFLHHGHRPPLPSFSACFRSIFRLHTETGNIWTHMIGCVAFIGIAAYFLTRSHDVIQWEDKLVFLAFFIGAIACLGMSFAFHTVHCHSEKVGKLFSKLDYVGISLLIMGSFVPWLFYGFYCRTEPKIVYMVLICVLGVACIVFSLWEKFGTPKYRPLRAGLFIGLGLCGVVPCVHYFITDGFWSAIYEASLGWIVLMAVLYITGALLYACRIPERFFPGKCDIWFQSHQIFHLFVIVAAFVHYHGVTEMAMYRLSQASCAEQFHALRNQIAS